MHRSGIDAANHLYGLAERALGRTVNGLTLHSASSGISGVLYDAFVFTIAFEEPRGNLAAGILLEGGRVMTAPFGQPFTLNSDDASVVAVLRRMDEWARLRLPDRYLERFDAIGTSLDAIGTPPTVDRAPASDASDLEYFAQVTYRDGVRVPVRVFRIENGVDQVYRDARTGWVPDDTGILREDRLGVHDHEIWPITRLQAGQSINMIQTGVYRPLDIPGLFD